MAKNNSTIGSTLIIPEGLVNDLKDVDDRIARIQQSSKATATEFNTQFGQMGLTARSVADGLQAIIDKLATIKQVAGEASAASAGIMAGADKKAGDVSKLAVAIVNISDAVNRLSNTDPTGGGATSMMERLGRLVDAVSIRVSGLGLNIVNLGKRASEMNNAELRSAEMAKQEAKVALMRQQTEVINQKANIEEAKSINLRTRAAAEAAKLAREEARLATARAQAAVAEERKVAIEERAARTATIRNNSQSAQTALDYAGNKDNVATYNQRAVAMKVLEQAMRNLNKEDGDYEKNLKRLADRYRELKNEQEKLMGAYREIREHHRTLLDTSGQLQRAFALLFSVSQIRGYVEKMAQVRGEFELQQRSLQAILQNKTEADSIFEKTVKLAVQSPFQIKELISYTKQLAAYRIESDKLYDTTKRLADVSAGLGVDMQRLILAYGQVKAAAYLRGTEVRQFTEAGINLYGELQAYFKDVKGEAYTTAQIVDMISKRMVTFEDVEQIFKRITDQGGIFYNMQAIQAETLQGKIANLKDSIDVMFNSMGKANEDTFKTMIDMTGTVIRNWDLMADAGKRLLEVLLMMKLQSMVTGQSMRDAFVAFAGFKAVGANATAMGMMTTGIMNVGRAFKAAGLMAKSALASMWPVLLITEGLSLIWNAVGAYQSLRKELSDITGEYASQEREIGKLIGGYNKLAEARRKAEAEGNKTFDFKANFEEEKSSLEEIQAKLAEYDLTLKVKLSQVTDDNIGDVVKDAETKLKTMSGMIADAKRYIAKDDAKFGGETFFGLLPDTFSQDMEDVDNAAADVASYMTRIRTSIDMVAARYDKLSDAAKQSFDKIKDGMKDGELPVNFVVRAYKELADLTSRSEFATPDLRPARQQFQDYALSLNGLRQQIEGMWQFDSQKATAQAQLRGLMETLGNEYDAGLKLMKPIEIRTFWNKVATAAGLSELNTYLLMEMASKKYGFKVTADQDEVKRQATWVDSYLENYFRGKTYSVKVNVTSTTDNVSNWLDNFTKKGDQAREAADKAEKAMRRLAQVGKNEKQIKVDEDLMNLLNSRAGSGYRPVELGQMVDVDEVKQVVAEYKKVAEEQAKALGATEKQQKQTAKTQRDIWTEQIDLLERLSTKYDELRKRKGAAESVETLKKMFAENIRYSKLDVNIIDKLLDPQTMEIDKTKLAKTIREISARFKEQTKKMSGLQKASEVELKAELKVDDASLDGVKKRIEDAFTGLEVYTDLRKLGLGDGDIAQMFGNIPRTFADVERVIAQEFAGKLGTDWEKQREEMEKKLRDKVVKYNMDTFKELTKAYKAKLDEQLQLDTWYAEERTKIETNEELRKNEALQRQYMANLNKQYAEKKDANAWKQFQGSDYYIQIFEHLDSTSTVVLRSMQQKLTELRGSLKNLSPEQLKQVVEQMDKIDSQIASNDPFGAAVSGLRGMVSWMRKRNETEQGYVASVREEDELRSKSQTQNEAVTKAKQQYDLAVSKYGVTSDEAREAKDVLDMEQAKLDVVLKQLVAQGKITEEYAKQIKAGQESTTKWQKGMGGLKDYVDQAAGAWGELSGMLEGFGVDVPDWIGETMSGVSQTLGGLSEMDLSKPFSIITGGMKAVAGLGNTIGSLFGLGSKDKKLQKQIEEQQRKVESLQKSYDDLKEKMDSAWDIGDIEKYKDETESALKQQIGAYEAMIRAEEDKKDTDEEKIKEWQDEIDQINKTLKENAATLAEQLGGFGSEANYKSAAEAFSDAWVTAFNEGSNTLDALNEKFDEYFDEMLKKQLMQRAAKRFLEPLLKAFDDAVAEGGEGGMEVTQGEIEKIRQLRGTALSGFDEYAKMLMEVMGVSPSGSGSLSALQQGIQSLTESTGQELESLLNSIRFYVAQQSSDVQMIRQMIGAMSAGGIQGGDGDTPMLTELRSQTNILGRIYGLMSQVVKVSGHVNGGAGVKVFVG